MIEEILILNPKDELMFYQMDYMRNKVYICDEIEILIKIHGEENIKSGEIIENCHFTILEKTFCHLC